MTRGPTQRISAGADAPPSRSCIGALNGREPFPWQRRLADEIAETEQWRAEVGVPTGLGKTACPGHRGVVAGITGGTGRRQTARRRPRIWWVVNRRLLVDSTAEHAERIARALTDPDSANIEGREREVVAQVAQRLGSLSATPGEPPPRSDPAARRGFIVYADRSIAAGHSAVHAAHVRLSTAVFAATGRTGRLRVVDAAMAGTDSLVLLDEAHLAPHLKALLPALADCTPGAPRRARRRPIGAPR